MLVVPMRVSLCIILPLRRLWRRFCDLCDQESSRCLSNAIDEYAEQGDLEEDKEADTKAEENSLTVVEPNLLLLRGESDAREVGFELCDISHWIMEIREATEHTSSRIKLLEAK